MRFTVTWTRSAQNELADIWTRATDRRAVADAANKIDRLLRASPMTVGQQYGTDRRLLIDPLEVIFSVHPDDCMLRVLKVTYSP
jgi:plasmid stabilization system protein ParE